MLGGMVDEDREVLISRVAIRHITHDHWRSAGSILEDARACEGVDQNDPFLESRDLHQVRG
jgi:hypothetical protein